MKIAGIIAEYNPFHAGHAYHILQTSKLYGADAVVCIMSGNFVQRGEAAIYDKWTRAQAAVLGGADLVLELPFFYATQSAEGFAHGALSILDALGCISILSFGSEAENMDDLRTVADVLSKEPAPFSSALKKQLSTGQSYPSARAQALKDFCSCVSEDVYCSPNNILGIEYLKALAQINSPIRPVHVVRHGGNHADRHLAPQYSSAASIRSEILRKGAANLKESDIPNAVRSLYTSEFVSPDAIFPYLLFRLRNMPLSEISDICEVTEGLEYKLRQAARDAQSYQQFIDIVKSKRYTQTRIQRIMLYIITGLTKQKARTLTSQSLYARVLAVKKERLGLLAELKTKSAIPVITRTCEFPENPLFDLDILSSDIYALLHKKIAPGKRDFTQKFLVI